MASDEVQPVTAQQPIEGELLNVLTTSNEQILNLISPTHLPDEENFDADCLLDAVKHERTKCIKNFLNNHFPGQKNLEKKGQKSLEEKVSRLGGNFNPQLLCILKQLSSKIACEAPSVEVIMSILNKLSNYSWEAKLLLILTAYSLNYEDFLNIPYDTLKEQKRQKMFRFNHAIDNTLRTMKYFLKVKKVTKDEPALLLDVAGDIPVGVYWIIVTCTTHDMCCLTSDEDKTQDLSPLVDKIRSIFSDLGMRISTIGDMYTRRKLKELFPKDAMQPLIDGSTNEHVSIDVLKEKNILLFISGLNIDMDRYLISNLMSIYDGIKKKGDQYKIVWIPIVEQWTNNSRRKFELLQSKMPWYIVQYFSVVAGIKLIEEQYDNKPIVLLMNPQGDVEIENALFLIQQHGMRAFPFTPDKNSIWSSWRRWNSGT